VSIGIPDAIAQSLHPCLGTRGGDLIVTFLCTNLRNYVARRPALEENRTMRGLAALLVAGGILFAVYHYYFQKMPTTDQGTAPTQAISLVSVREDLLLIAHAETGYIGQNGHCVSLDELISSGAFAMSHAAPDGYTYSIACSGTSDFSVTARHAPAPAGSPIRYPTLAIDQSMDVHEVN
jgi:hypothetical protein